MNKTYLHIGTGKQNKHEGVINLREEDMDITKPWPYADASVDGIVAQQVFVVLTWRELVPALKECYRVLKKGGVLRFSATFVDSYKDLDWLLGWDIQILLNFSLMARVLQLIGFQEVHTSEYQQSSIPEFNPIDNKPYGFGNSFLECIK